MPNRSCEIERRVCRVLITGAGSYIGSSVEAWLCSMPDRYRVTVLEMESDMWKVFDFSHYDVVFHVAGLVHRKMKYSEAERDRYYMVNTKLAVEVARRAKVCGVRQFVFMSSMNVYSGCNESHITEDTVPCVESPTRNPYGYSKLKAEEALLQMQSDLFRIVILRAPMVYGPGCKGNYARLEWLVKHIRIFPKVENRRSVLQIETLCRFVQLMIEKQKSGIFFPQDKDYGNTSEMVVRLAEANDRHVYLVPGMTGLVRVLCKFPGIGATMTKMFSDRTYARTLPGYAELHKFED